MKNGRDLVNPYVGTVVDETVVKDPGYVVEIFVWIFFFNLLLFLFL
jgi:hypothetical protein